MKVKEKIVDHNPGETIHELDVITFRETDPSRWAVKGHIATVVDMLNAERFGYLVECYNGEASRFQKHEFRPATQLDIERYKEMYAKKNEREIKREAQLLARKNPPPMPELGEDAFKIKKYILGVA